MDLSSWNLFLLIVVVVVVWMGGVDDVLWMKGKICGVFFTLRFYFPLPPKEEGKKKELRFPLSFSLFPVL